VKAGLIGKAEVISALQLEEGCQTGRHSIARLSLTNCSKDVALEI